MSVETEVADSLCYSAAVGGRLAVILRQRWPAASQSAAIHPGAAPTIPRAARVA